MAIIRPYDFDDLGANGADVDAALLARGWHQADNTRQHTAAAKVRTVLKKANDGSMELTQVPVPELTSDQSAIIEEMK